MTPPRLIIISIVLAVSLLGLPRFTLADIAVDIQTKIDTNKQQIDSLEADIAAFQKQLDALGAKKNTLQSTISSLELSQKKLASQIKVTQNKISSANLQIQQLTLSIGDKETSISADQAAISKHLREVTELEQVPLAAQLISSDSFSMAWREADQSVQFNHALAINIDNLQTTRKALGTDRDTITTTKNNLLALKADLSTQKKSVDATKVAEQQLLAQTKNQESSYQALIKQKQAAERAFEQELTDLQTQLNLIVHPGLLPKIGSGVLVWPFSSAFMYNCSQRKSIFGNLFCVTQYFGNTPFSTANPQIYNGHGHNAIDIAAPIGTPVDAALSGTVLGTGNTDLVRGCYSFGKWVMIEHGNGLNTLYAHLSSIEVAKGQTVSTGQLIGFSGMTGYATGPHLHFGVYASEGTKIMTLRQFRGSTIGCADATMPVATLTAYLNPLSYL